jgi:hypothetical protein
MILQVQVVDLVVQDIDEILDSTLLYVKVLPRGRS